jgi:glutathione S-transferase
MPTAAPKAILYHSPQCGSTVVQIALKVLNVPYNLISFDFSKYKAGEYKDTPDYEEFKLFNPLTQFPTLITEEGAVITELAAILFCELSLLGWDPVYDRRSF